MYNLAESGVAKKDAVSFKDSITEAIRMAEAAYNRGGTVSGVTTGLAELDRMTGGMHPTDLLILAGRPSMGKTALATNIAFNAAKRHLETGGREGAAVGLFSLEMGHAQIIIFRAQHMADSAPLIDNPEIITMLKAVANGQRYTIIKELIKGEKNVGELESYSTLSQSALSQHLARLRRDKIVETRRQAQLIYYYLSNQNVISLVKYLDQMATEGDRQD